MLCLVRAYQLVLSPWLGAGCRYLPTCSEYATDALRTHGAARGAWLTVGRLLRCHPWGGHGLDPVPEPAVKPPWVTHDGRGTDSLPQTADSERLANPEPPARSANEEVRA